MKPQDLEKLVNLANTLDKHGMRKEADLLDEIIKEAGLPPFLEKCPGCDGAMKKGAKMCKKCQDKE